MNKKLIALLTLVMFVMSFTGMAFAATSNVVLTSKTVADKDGVQLGSIRILEKSDYIGSLSNDTLTFTFQDGFEFSNSFRDLTDTAQKAAIVKLFDVENNGSAASDVVVESVTDTGFTVSLTGVDQSLQTKITVDFAADAAVKFDASGYQGDIKVAIESVEGGVTAGTLTVGKVVDGDTDAKALSTKTLELDKTAQTLGTLRITENAPASVATGKDCVVKLPADFTFDGLPTVSLYGGFSGSATASYTTVDGYSAIRFQIPTASTSSRGVIELSGWTVDVDKDADLGDVEVTTDGEFSDQDIVLGTVAEYGIVLEADSAKTLYQGESKEKIATFYIKENAPGTIIADRKIRVTLPKGFAWDPAKVNTTNIKATEGGFGTLAVSLDTENYREITITPDNFSTKASKIKFDELKVIVAPNADLGDLEVEFDGRAGVEGTLKVAEIKAPIEVEVDSTDIVIGKQEQKVADIVIKENVKEMFRADKDLIVYLNDAFTFSKTPKVEVVEGDVRIDDVDRASVDGYKNAIKITFDKTSKKPSTIKITDIYVDADRTIAEGSYKYEVYGSSMNKAYEENKTTDIVEDDALDISEKTKFVKVVGVKVVTPAPEEAGAVKEVKMTVGSTVYTTDGVEMTMDAAPYLKNGRTYFPVRYVAQAVGISSENVVWDPSERTVTIFKAERIVQVKIGSATMLVNGIPVTMDAAPEVTNGRTMLPIRFVAQALGLDVAWDAATQTVTLN